VKRREAIKILGTTVGGLFIAQFIPGCKNIFAPDPTPPGKSYDTVEFMYQRVLPIINPSAPDPTGAMWGEGFSGSITGGKLSDWCSTGLNEWQGWGVMNYSQYGHYVWTGDGKVRPYGAIATKFFARIQGQQNWIELPVEQNGLVDGEWAKFLFNKGVLSVPGSSSFSR
jgi:hypothetical protein